MIRFLAPPTALATLNFTSFLDINCLTGNFLLKSENNKFSFWGKSNAKRYSLTRWGEPECRSQRSIRHLQSVAPKRGGQSSKLCIEIGVVSEPSFQYVSRWEKNPIDFILRSCAAQRTDFFFLLKRKKSTPLCTLKNNRQIKKKHFP